MKQGSGEQVNSITTLESREIYRNQWLRLREDRILRSNGKQGIYSVVDKHDCAAIIAIQDNKIWLVEQFRYTIQERAMELPQGGWEMEIENPEELARGELKEETGLHAAEMVYLGFLWIAYGYSRQKQHVLLSLDVEKSDMATTGKFCAQCTRKDQDYALAWIKSYGKGRVYITPLGHTNIFYTSKAWVQHVLGAVQFVLGDLEADTTPSAKVKK